MTTTLERDQLEAIKAKQQATWASGDYAVIGTTLQLVGESLCEAVDVSAGWKVLDVAAGNGNASMAAARRGCDVIATDYVPALLEGTRARAAAEGLPMEVRQADAEDLPFDDGAFDAVLSTFGVMFVPDPDRAAAELVRVCRPGGAIGLANWTPEGFIGQMFKVVGAHVPPPAGIRSPLAWGSDERLAELFGSDCDLQVERRHFTFRYRSAEHFVEVFRDFYGPVHRAWHSLDDAGRTAFEQDLLALLRQHDRSTTDALAVPSEYVEVVARRRP